MTSAAVPLHTEVAALLPRLRRVGRAIAFNRDDADDLVQLAVERALNRSEQWAPGTPLDTCLFRIMKNAWTDDIGMRRRALSIDGDADEPLDGESSDAHRQRIATQRAVHMLADDYRLVVALVLVDGLSYRDAAEVLDIPAATLAGRLARARAALRASLSDQLRNVS